jgi:hypothetical protein
MVGILPRPNAHRNLQKRSQMDAVTNLIPAEQITKSAAYLVAAMRTTTHASGLDLEIRDSLAILEEELDAAGYLAPYKGEDGSLRI